ncbi:MAG: hypothetical protein QOJ01_1729 [Solirubrobacterales bacterium]|nr:hypothetical protein [Solirubrobacterales bacterium]
MVASQSTEDGAGQRRRAGWRTPGVRLAAVGALIVFGSLLLPWYGVQLKLFQVISESGVGALGGAAFALVLTAGGALYLATRTARGYRLPRPLSASGVMIAAGVWCTVLTGLLTLERPGDILGITPVEVRYGVFVALGGALTILVGGLRMRQK